MCEKGVRQDGFTKATKIYGFTAKPGTSYKIEANGVKFEFNVADINPKAVEVDKEKLEWAEQIVRYAWRPCYSNNGDTACVFCCETAKSHKNIQHDSWCPVTQAKAYIDKHTVKHHDYYEPEI